MVIIIYGPPSSGKTRLGTLIQQVTGIPYIDIDDVYATKQLSDYQTRIVPEIVKLGEVVTSGCFNLAILDLFFQQSSPLLLRSIVDSDTQIKLNNSKLVAVQNLQYEFPAVNNHYDIVNTGVEDTEISLPNDLDIFSFLQHPSLASLGLHVTKVLDYSPVCS
jgi:hypothetical protein